MLTIFTPTYNRAYVLPRLYKSLIEQKNKDFEWVIVDDGSTDNTEILVKKWIDEEKIKILYYQQENQGKPIAHNLGVKNSNGELFTCVDSDDYLISNATEIILNKWNDAKENKNCVGIVGKCIFANGKNVGTDMPFGIEFSTLSDLYNKYKFRGDTILILKTEEIKKYTFPKIEGEKFIPETYLYDKIDQDGELATIQEGIYICEYLQDGYTANSAKLIKDNPKGYILMAEQKLTLAKTIKEKYKACAQYVLGSILANEKGYIKKANKKILTVLSLPCAYIVYYKKYLK